MKLTVKEVSVKIEETPAVIRNWVREFKQHIPIEKGENGYNYYGPEAIEVLLKIKRLHRDQGYSTKQIEHYLATGEDAAPVPAAVLPDQLAEVKAMLQTVLENQKKEEEFKLELVRRMDERDRQLTDYLAERSQQRLLESKSKRKLSLWDRIMKPKKFNDNKY